MESYCEQCECERCKAKTKAKAFKDEAQDACKRWNWNAHPIEIVDEMSSMDEERIAAYLDAIEECFGFDTMARIKDDLEHLGAI
jgi:hypothetical protein